MSFGASAGPAAAPVQVSAIIPGPGADQSAYDAAENLEFQTLDGSHVKGGSSEDLATMIYSMIDGLLPYADATQDGSAGDTGVLVSAAAGANQHGLPANFGPGRGNWSASDLHRLSIELVKDHGTPVAGGSVEIVSIAIFGGDIAIVVKNLSTIKVALLDIRAKYEHSLGY